MSAKEKISITNSGMGHSVSKGVEIHRTAVIHKRASLGEGVKVGPYTIIGEKVQVGRNTRIHAHVMIEGHTEIGENCQIFNGTVIGTPPQSLKYQGEDTRVVIGDNNIIREYVTINKGTTATGETRIGNNCMLMAYVHIAHDCVLGNDVFLANVATLGGHVVVEDKAIIGGLTPVHQFVRIGTLAIVGGGSRTAKDVPPYCKAAGVPIRMYGLNSVGLSRNNFPPLVKEQLKMVYKTVFRSNLNTSQALEVLSKKSDFFDEAKHFINFVRESERGICKEYE